MKLENTSNISYITDIIGTSDINKPFYETICTEDKPFKILVTQECVDYCSVNDIKNNLCELNFKTEKKKENSENGENEGNEEEDFKAEEILLKNVEKDFTSGQYNTSNIENGEDDIIQNEKITITLTTTDNQKNNKNSNMT